MTTTVEAIEQTPSTLPARLRAAGVHFGISALIFLALLYVIVFRWYPGVHFGIDGGWQGVRIMVLVDLVLGPTLTLLIFNPRKSRREIAFDLSCIATVQALALAWGLWAVHSQHPLAIVASQGKFYSVNAEPLARQGIGASDLETLSGERPAIIYAKPPQGVEEAKRLIETATSLAVSEYEQFQFFRPLREHLSDAFAKSLDIEALAAQDPNLKQALESLLQDTGYRRDELVFMPLVARYGKAILVFTKDGARLGSLPQHE